MEVYMEQIPEGVTIEEYPPGTQFVFSEPVRKRDPITHELLPREKKPLIYPRDCN